MAFSLGDLPEQPASNPEAGSLSYWGSLARSAIFGAQTVGQLLATDLTQLRMVIELGVTEFNFDLQRFLNSYEAYKQAYFRIRQEIDLLPAPSSFCKTTIKKR